jgi:hypothetical protein
MMTFHFPYKLRHHIRHHIRHVQLTCGDRIENQTIFQYLRCVVLGLLNPDICAQLYPASRGASLCPPRFAPHYVAW